MTQQSINDNFTAWLRTAHAMEQQAITMLTAQSNRLESYPALRSRIAQHITESEDQQRQIENILERYETGSSAFKDMTATAMASMQAFGGMFAGDEVIKGSQMGYTFEHLEISTYTALIAAAEKLGDHASARILQGIRRQEEEMANWLLANLPEVVSAFLDRDAAGMQAQR